MQAIVALLLLLPLLLSSSEAKQPLPRFTSAHDAITSRGDLTMEAVEDRLPPTSTPTRYVLSAQAEVFWACVGRPPKPRPYVGLRPQILSQEEIVAPLHRRTVHAPTGTGAARITLRLAVPPSAGLVCPPKQQRRLARVSYVGIRLTDKTHGVVAYGDGAVRTFVR